jgi:large subunit ribosomal protein L6
MSRIGKKPIPLPPEVEVSVAGQTVTVKGPLGELTWQVQPGISVVASNGSLLVKRAGDTRQLRALHGLVRAELNNMIIGVTRGYEKTLEMTGVGYKAQLQGQTLLLNVGYTQPVSFEVPKGIEIKVDKQTVITLRGIDKRLVGQTAANLRAVKPPDVYKQKGIRYAGEVLRKKEGKTGK